MKKILLVIISVFIISSLFSCQRNTKLTSPDKSIELNFDLSQKGEPFYNVNYNGQTIIDNSFLGFAFDSLKLLKENLAIENAFEETYNNTWETVWGENKSIHNYYNELVVELKETVAPHRLLILYFRAYDDGIAFRYEFPEQSFMNNFVITEELSEFNFTGNHSAWWIYADYNTYEKLYKNTPLSEVPWAATPFTMKTKDNLYLSVHEAALTNYAGMTLKKSESDSLSFFASLVPYKDGKKKVIASVPFQTPWRTVQISNSAKGLVESNLILNLNEPSKIENTSWITPMKYVGIWWGMHLGLETWHQGDRHGATTKNAKKYIDFAAENNIKGVLYEGWNTGWENWGKPKAFDFVTSYDDFDINEISEYAERKRVEIIGHHETGGDFLTYEKYLDSSFAMYNKFGINSVKTGYAGPISNGEHHHGQIMVNHYRKVVEAAAKYQIMIDAHEPLKATGIRRTYPNMMTREGARGMEWNAWSEGNPPEHTCILPFTRCLGGPLDYTPGIFDVLLKSFSNKRKKWNTNDISKTRVHSTVAKQLALMVVLYSPLQMAADLVENYEGKPEFKFIRNLKMNYDKSIVLNGEIGDYITIARKSGDEWFIGSITDENARSLEIALDFLDKDIKYAVEIYADGKDADWETNPYPVDIRKGKIDLTGILKIDLAPGGGQALRIYPID